MERLTYDDLNKVCYDPWELCGMDNYCKKGCHEEGGCTKGCHILKIYRKLAKYEDMEGSGRLLELPCKIGDTAHIVANGNVFPSEVTDISKKFVFFNGFQISVGRIGKELFFNKDQSERASKEVG